MSEFIGIQLPFNGTFSQANPTQWFENDYILLDESRVVYYAQQTNQGIGYIGIANVTNFGTDIDPQRTIERQQLLHIGEINAVKLFKIAEDRVMVIVDRKIYILDFDGFTFTVVYEENDVFIGGMLTRANSQNNGTTALNWVANSVKDNELLFVDCEATNSFITNGAIYKFYRLVYNPVAGTLSKILKKDFSLDFNLNANEQPIRYNGRIEHIPGSTSKYMWLGRVDSISQMPYIYYSAIIDNEGNELSQLPFPGHIPTHNDATPTRDSTNWTTYAVALREDLVVYFSGAGRTAVYFNGELTTTLQNTGLPNYDDNISLADIKAIDGNHYLAHWSNGSTYYTSVFRVDSTNLITSKASYDTAFTLVTPSVSILRNNTLEYYGGDSWLIRIGSYTNSATNLPTPDQGIQTFVFYYYRRIDLA